MNRFIKLNCPFCDNCIIIEISNQFEVVSVSVDTHKLSEEEQKEFLKKHGLEFG